VIDRVAALLDRDEEVPVALAELYDRTREEGT
jgi:hypothetical protein